MTETIVRKRGRPKGTGRVDPQLIVDAALDALADGGYPALTMRGVARAVGVSLATLQHHFPTKDALWRAALDRLTNDTIARNSSVDPTDLAAKIATFLEQGSARPGLLAALLSDRSPGAPERIADIAERFVAPFEVSDRRLSGMEDAGLTRPVDHRALLMLVMIGVGSIAGARDAVRTVYGFDLDTDDGRDELAAALADIIGLGVLRR